MSITLTNWSSRTAIDARMAEYRRPQNGFEPTIPGDYHMPFGKAEARSKVATWLWQAYII
jgi:hypothetical protein